MDGDVLDLENWRNFCLDEEHDDNGGWYLGDQFKVVIEG